MAKGHRSQIKREREMRTRKTPDLQVSYLMQEFQFRRLVMC